MARRHVGIRRKRQGWQAYVQVHGTTYTKMFPLDQPLAEMRAWRDNQVETRGGPYLVDPLNAAWLAGWLAAKADAEIVSKRLKKGGA